MERQDSRSYVPPFEKLAILKAYKCSSCNRIYSTQVYANSVTGRIPLLMPCSHTICEECLSHMAKTKNISCRVCQYEMLMESLDALANYFPVDRFMFGSLMNLNIEVLKRNNSEKSKHAVVPFTPAGALFNKPTKILKRGVKIKDISPEKDVEKCSQTGCSKRAEFRCINCTELYCAKCDKRVHESIKILRHHNRYPIGIADLADYNVSCVVHSDSIGEYSCLTCGTMLCSKCVIKNHTAHEVIAIEDKNAQELEVFKEALRKGKTVLKSMEFTQKKVKLEINSTRQNLKPTHLEYEIIKHFASLHSRLQLLEQTMLDQFSKAQVARVDSLHRLSSELSANIAIMHSLVATGNMVVEGGKAHLDKLLLSELQKNITENLILPCELIEENGNGGSKKEDTIRFITDDKFMESLQNHCSIKFEEGQSFKLTPMTDFSDRKYDMPSDDGTIDSSDTDSIRSRNESESSGTSQISYLTPGCKTRLSLAGSIPTLYGGEERKREKPKNANEPIVFVKDTIETVKVTHLTNPSNFYVQLSRKKKEIEELTNKYEIYAEHAAIPSKPEIGNTYIVQFTSASNSNWYRALVKDILTTGLTTLYEVFYIDYGNAAVVPLSKIRVIKPIFMQDAPFAYKCRLNGIIAQRNEWNDEVLKYMLKFITAVKDPPLDPLRLDDFMIYENRNNTLKMHVIQNHKGILDVDLYSHNESLSAGLIFVGYAQPMAHLFEKKRRALDTEIKIISAIDNYRKDNVYSIYVSHVVNPYCVFVQLSTNRKIIKNLETAMTRYYEKKDQRRSIFTPEKGMVCVAKLPCSNNNWWRVEIVNLPGGANVQVFALDFGNTETVPWNSLCKIKDIHKQTDAQAIKVSLSDIAPPKDAENEWPETTNEFLRTYLKNKDLTMYVNENKKDKLLVTIYEHTDETDICIDALLVRKNLAESTNESSLLVEFHKNVPGEDEPEGATKKDLGQLLRELNPQSYDEDSKNMFRGKHYIVDVKLLKLESPSSFYVEVVRWSDEKIKMITRMAKYYTDKISPAKKWDLKAKCVVKSAKDERYYRAVVTKVLEDDCYEVFLKDLVRYEEVPTRNLYELNELFATHDYSLHCRLGGMKPTGGSEKWPSQATELFQDFLDQYNRICISKYGSIVDNVLSVQLFTMWDEKVGPLDPLKIHTLVLNDILLCSGLAIPVKVNMNDCVIKGTVSPSLAQLPKINKNPAVSSLHNKLFSEEYDSSLAPLSKLIEDIKPVTISLEDIKPPVPTTWLPPVKFTEKHFKAYTSYVDHDGSIYIQTLKARRMLKNVCRLLENHFKTSESELQKTWEVGQMCTMLYHQDKTYCRATITDITGEKIIVKLVDYGNQEEVTHEELRKEVLATDIPALAVKCKLSNVVPKTQDKTWSTHLLDRLHFTLVDKQCELVIDNSDGSGDDVPHVLLYIENECINNLCNSAEWSQTMPELIPKPDDSDEEKDVVIEDEIDIDIDIADCSAEDISQTHDELFNSDMGYNYVQLPKNLKSFRAVIINLIDYRTIIVEPEFAAGIMKTTCDKFDAMSNEIVKCGTEQPEILVPNIGMPCIAVFGSDEKWYRAQILDIMDILGREIKVLFIDYGNVEIVPKEDVRATKPEWIKFPVSMIQVKIWGILKHPDYDVIDVNTAMKDAVVDQNVICQIQSNSSEIEVKLINEETYELAYKHLLDANMIQSIN